jgi:hypothetical protein
MRVVRVCKNESMRERQERKQAKDEAKQERKERKRRSVKLVKLLNSLNLGLCARPDGTFTVVDLVPGHDGVENDVPSGEEWLSAKSTRMMRGQQPDRNDAGYDVEHSREV